MEDLADCDLIIEAVFERMDIKKDVFARLDKIAKPGAILASNTSFLDIDEIAAATVAARSCAGPAFLLARQCDEAAGDRARRQNVRKVLATAMKLAKAIGKVGVLVGVAHGFVGNRMLDGAPGRSRQVVLEGALPWDIDRVLVDFGFPMGAFRHVGSGGARSGLGEGGSHGETLRDLLNEMGRSGQKTRRRLLRL